MFSPPSRWTPSGDRPFRFSRIPQTHFVRNCFPFCVILNTFSPGNSLVHAKPSQGCGGDRRSGGGSLFAWVAYSHLKRWFDTTLFLSTGLKFIIALFLFPFSSPYHPFRSQGGGLLYYRWWGRWGWAKFAWIGIDQSAPSFT